MRFILSRYFHAVSRRLTWLPAALIPVALFLAGAALLPARHQVEQSIRIESGTPVARPSSPVDFEPAERLVSRGDFLFDNELVGILEARIDFPGVPMNELPLRLRREIQRTMQAGWEGENLLKISYSGKDPGFGRTLVEFFASSLITRAEEGRLRATSQPRSRSLEAGVNLESTPAQLVGGLIQSVDRRLWTAERLEPAVMVFLVSLFVILFVIGLIEWFDPAFKSERQVVRYLDIPILGSIPDLDNVLRRLKDASRS